MQGLDQFRRRRLKARGGDLDDDGAEDRSLAYQRLVRELLEAQRRATSTWKTPGWRSRPDVLASPGDCSIWTTGGGQVAVAESFVLQQPPLPRRHGRHRCREPANCCGPLRRTRDLIITIDVRVIHAAAHYLPSPHNYLGEGRAGIGA
jgi:hypothetical protein